MKRIFWQVLVIAIVIAILILLWQFSISIVLFLVALGLSAALRPSINQITARVRSRRLALGLVYSTFIGFMACFSIAGGQLVLQDLQKASDDFVITYDRVKTEWSLKGSIFEQTLAEQLPSSDDLYQAMTSKEGIVILARNSGSGQNLFSMTGYVSIVLVLSIYWSADQSRFERALISLFRREHRPRAIHVWGEVENAVGAYIRSKFVQSVMAGLILGAGYWAGGLRYPALLALWGALAGLIPGFGVLIAPIPLLFLARAPITAFLAIGFTILVLRLTRAVIEPRFFHQNWTNSLLSVLFVIIMAAAFGLIGIFLAAPLAVAVQVLLQELSPLFSRRYSQELLEAFELKKRLSRIRKHKDIKDPAFSDLNQLIGRLQGLVSQTITYLQKY